jgi:hypothetical protein
MWPWTRHSSTSCSYCSIKMRIIGGAVRGVRKLVVNQLKSYILFSVGLYLGELVRHTAMKLFHRHKHHEGERRASSLNDHGRTFAVVTTAAMPWRTGGLAWGQQGVLCVLKAHIGGYESDQTDHQKSSPPVLPALAGCQVSHCPHRPAALSHTVW